ncbi:hypothetical protein ACQP00_25160 [Dactylosporangium sp. CS-047395]|uniref:hypothetical protein n=1 Tax=Dactylosporangium sp. CS-047395 TaxID=3239936 RepID=UPI003D925F09
MGRIATAALGLIVLIATSCGNSAAPAAPAPELIAFVMVQDAGTGGAVEISAPDQIDRLAPGPAAAIDSARTAVTQHARPDVRIFAFVRPGCQNDGATIALGSKQITATLTGGEDTACVVAEWYLAVFAVPAQLVPPGASVG